MYFTPRCCSCACTTPPLRVWSPFHMRARCVFRQSRVGVALEHAGRNTPEHCLMEHSLSRQLRRALTRPSTCRPIAYAPKQSPSACGPGLVVALLLGVLALFGILDKTVFASHKASTVASATTTKTAVPSTLVASYGASFNGGACARRYNHFFSPSLTLFCGYLRRRGMVYSLGPFSSPPSLLS